MKEELSEVWVWKGWCEVEGICECLSDELSADSMELPTLKSGKAKL